MANNTLIGALRAEATLESGKFVDGAKKIRKETKATEVQVKQSFGAMGSSVKGFGTALTAGLSIGLLGGLIKKSLDFATSIKDVAKQAGVTTTELQEFRYAASQVGIAEAAADKGLESLNKTLSKAASGSKTASAALAAVGVTLKDIQTKSRLEIFGQIADQMNKQGGAAKNAAAANAIFGEGAAKLVPLLDKGSQGVNELRESVHRLGGVLSEDQIQRADETARKLDDVRRVLAAQIAGVVSDNASSIVGLASALGQLTSAVVNFLGSDPQLAATIIGALAGARIGGLPGALAGGIAGLEVGTRIRDNMPLPAHTKADVPFLRHNVAVTQAELRAKRNKGIPIKQSEVDRLKRMTDKLNAAAGNAPSSGGFGGDLPQFLAGAPPKGRKARTPKAPRDRSDDVTFQFDQELRRAQVDVLRAQQGMARTSEERASIALQLLDAEREMQEAELNNRVRRAERDFAEGKITESALEQAKLQAEKLRAEYDSVDALQRQAIADDLAADKARDAQELSDSAYDLRLEQLQLESALAETAGERREAELRILDLMKQQEKARLEAVIADTESSELAKEEAKLRLAKLDELYAGRADVARQGTRGAGEDYLASLPTDAAKMQEALDGVKVRGLQSLEQGILDVTTGVKSMGEAFKEVADQIIADLLRIAIQRAIIIPLANALFPGSGGVAAGLAGGGGGTALFGPSNPGVGFAHGGGFNVKGIQGFDKNMLSLNGLPIANVSYGERVSVSNDNDGGYMSNGPLIGNITLPPGMTQREGRATGLAIGRGIQDRLGYTVTGRKR